MAKGPREHTPLLVLWLSETLLISTPLEEDAAAAEPEDGQDDTGLHAVDRQEGRQVLAVERQEVGGREEGDLRAVDWEEVRQPLRTLDGQKERRGTHCSSGPQAQKVPSVGGKALSRRYNHPGAIRELHHFAHDAGKAVNETHGQEDEERFHGVHTRSVDESPD